MNYIHSRKLLVMPIFILAFLLFGASPAHASTTINSCSDLQNMNNNRSEDYVLGQNIDCTGHDPDEDGSGFDPIGSSSQSFTGSFDGAGYTISGFTIDRSGESYMGLFANLGAGATVENVTFASPSVTGDDFVGVVAGYSASANITIDNITITSPVVSGSSYVGGVIGRVGAGPATLSNLKLTSADIDGTEGDVGGISGYLLGTAGNVVTLSDSMVTGSVTSTSGINHGGMIGIFQNYSAGARLYFNGTVSGFNRVGGIAGQTNVDYDSLEDFMVRGSVTGNDYVGGIIGWQFGTLPDNGYSTADVSGTGGSVGGTIGSGTGCTDVFLLNSVSETGGDCHTLKSDAELQDIATYTDETTVGLTNAWDFIGTVNDDAAGNDYWAITAIDNDGYPFLNGLGFVTFSAGDGSSGDPYEIDSCELLQLIENDLGTSGDETYYELTGNIDCSDTVNWNDGAGFDPLGDDENPAYVNLGGQGVTTYNITDLYINRPTEDYVGLFGYTADDTYLDRMRLQDAQITGRNYVGGLVGQNFGDAAYLHVSGEVTGEDYVGGLFGLFSKGTAQMDGVDVDVEGDSHVGGAVGWMADDSNSNLWRVYSVGAVHASEEYAGGLVGRMYDVEGGNAMYIYDSYSLGPVVGRDYVGGLVGSAEGNLSDRVNRSYSAGLVASPGSRVGGLVGNGSGGASSLDSFWDTETSGQSTSALDETGKTTAQMTNVVTFTETDTEGLASAWDFVGNPNDDASNNNYWTIDSEENDGYPYINVIPDGAPTVTSVFLMYYADPDDGSITGTKLQRLSAGGDGSEVIATASGRKTFASWTGGSTTAARTDTSVTEDAIYIASFRNRSSGNREEAVVIEPKITFMSLNDNDQYLEYSYQGEAPFVNIDVSADGESWINVVNNGQNTGAYQFDEADNILQMNYVRLQLTDLVNVLDTGTLERNTHVDSEEDVVIDDAANVETGSNDEEDVTNEEKFVFPDEAISPFDGSMEPVDVVEPGDLIRGENYSTVYLITEDYKRRPFWNEAIYATYYDSFDDVVEVTDATLGVLKLGNPMMPNPETVLVKVQSLSDVHLPTVMNDENVRRRLPSETVAASLFGDLWADYVIDLPVGVHRWYTEGDDLSETDSVDRTRLRKRVELNIR